MALTSKQQVFIAEYLKCWNASEAARRAGYTENSARAQGSRLLTDADISAEIERRKAEIIMSADEVASRLTEQARAGYAAYFTDLGTVDIATLIKDGKGHLIKKIKPTKDGLEVEFHDVQAALVHLAKINGMMIDRAEVTGKDGKPQEHVFRQMSDEELERYIRSGA